MVFEFHGGEGLEAAGFDAIAADFHVAPAASAIFAGVDEEPAAVLGSAAANCLENLNY